MIVSIVRFRSALSEPEVLDCFAERADRYRDVPGLVEKIYLRFPATGEFGAIYVWESEEALAHFRQSDLARSIADVYRVEQAPSAELAEVCLVVRPSAATSAPV
jgi:heme-degrading monooxygenase HmoA